MLELWNIEHFLTEVTQKGIDGCVHARAIQASWQNVTEGSLKRCHRLSGVVKWVGEHLFESGVNTGHISEAGLGHQSICEFSIGVVVISREALFGAFDSSREDAPHLVLIEDALHRLLRYGAKHFTQYATYLIGEDSLDHGCSSSDSLSAFTHGYNELIVS